MYNVYNIFINVNLAQWYSVFELVDVIAGATVVTFVQKKDGINY